MKVGDLVKLKQHCRDSDRWATIISVHDFWDCVRIVFLDDGQTADAIKNNIEVISESR
jgi:hypothetical protein